MTTADWVAVLLGAGSLLAVVFNAGIRWRKAQEWRQEKKQLVEQWAAEKQGIRKDVDNIAAIGRSNAARGDWRHRRLLRALILIAPKHAKGIVALLEEE